MSSELIHILIADDHILFRDGLRALLSSTSDTMLVGEAVNGDEAVALAMQRQPDVVLMDIQMPGLNGIEATRRIVEMSPHINVLIVTMFEDDQSVFAAMQAGARGYILKGAKHTELLRAIRAVSEGEAIFSPAIAVRLMAYFSNMRPTLAPPLFPELSEREREILMLIVQGDKNTAIAEKLVLSAKTVRNHVSNVTIQGCIKLDRHLPYSHGSLMT